MLRKIRILPVVPGLLLALSACSSSSSVTSVDAASDGTHADAKTDGRADSTSPSADGGHDAGHDAIVDVGVDVILPTAALVRLANWSPDAPGLDFCIAPHGTGAFTGPILAGALGGAKPLGPVTVLDAGIPFDTGAPLVDAGVDASDAAVDASVPIVDGGTDAPRDASGAADAGHDAGDANLGTDAATPTTGVLFPGVSPYVSLTPGDYDVRIVASSALDCSTGLFADTIDLAALVAGTTETLAIVGDVTDQGTDPPAAIVALPDDTTVSASHVAMRFVNAVPSVVGVTFAAGTVATATAAPYLVAAQFGGAGVDTDAGILDSNAYLETPPITGAVWSLINANGGTTTLVAVEGAHVPAGRLATIVAVGGESGPNEAAIGILACTDTPPIAAGETATCVLYEADDDPVCPACL